MLCQDIKRRKKIERLGGCEEDMKIRGKQKTPRKPIIFGKVISKYGCL
jgi:hypothetical protein